MRKGRQYRKLKWHFAIRIAGEETRQFNFLHCLPFLIYIYFTYYIRIGQSAAWYAVSWILIWNFPYIMFIYLINIHQYIKGSDKGGDYAEK